MERRKTIKFLDRGKMYHTGFVNGFEMIPKSTCNQNKK
jgi:hypothetical protein